MSWQYSTNFSLNSSVPYFLVSARTDSVRNKPIVGSDSEIESFWYQRTWFEDIAQDKRPPMQLEAWSPTMQAS